MIDLHRKGRFIFSVFIGKVFVRIYLIVTILVILFPLFWMFSLSFRRIHEISQSRFLIIPINIETGNYRNAIMSIAERGHSITILFKNSIIITFVSILITITIASAAGYAFAKFRFKGNMAIFYSVLIGIMIPVQALLIPIFLLTRYIGLIKNYFSIILPYVAFGIPISTFIMRGFFKGVSNNIIEAARIDGASEFGIFLRICLPIARPALATCIIFLFLQNWNEFMLALVLLMDKNIFTIPVGITKIIMEYHTPWGQYAALIFMTLIPVVITYGIFQNWFIKGLTAGSIKG